VYKASAITPIVVSRVALIYRNADPHGVILSDGMATFLYRCPNTGFRVQGYTPEQSSDHADAYEVMTCLACQRVHLVNPATGKVLGEDG
jgi:hypothetical protein